MALSLFLSTLITLIFPIVAYFFYQAENRSLVAPFIYGAANWSVIAVIQLVILQIINLITHFELANYSSSDAYIQVQTKARTILFWYLFFVAVLGNILLFMGSNKVLSGDKVSEYAIFGLGWGVAEYIQRFLFFGTANTGLVIYFVFYAILLSVSLGVVFIRMSENSKFLMFVSIIKFFSELALFGAIGYQFISASLADLYYILIFAVSLALLSMITRKYPLKD